MSSPKPDLRSIAKQSAKEADRRLSVSFQYVDWRTEGFFVHGGDEKFYEHLFNALHKLTKYTEEQFKVQRPEELTPKFLNWGHKTITQNSFPISRLCIDEEICREAFEIRITKNSGRIHGFIFNSTFYVVWFDPAHNLFPGMEKNRLKEVRKASDYVRVRCFSAEEFNKLTAMIEELQVENKTLNEYLEKHTSP